MAGLVGAPILVSSSRDIAVVMEERRLSGETVYFAHGKGEDFQLRRDEFEIFPPAAAVTMGISLEVMENAVAGRSLACVGKGVVPHAQAKAVWFPISMDKTLVAVCPTCLHYHLGGS